MNIVNKKQKKQKIRSSREMVEREARANVQRWQLKSDPLSGALTSQRPNTGLLNYELETARM